MKWLQHLTTRYILHRYPVPRQIWEENLHETYLFSGLSAVEKAHLRELVTLFLHKKSINGVQGLKVTPRMAVTIAAQACLPILNLGLDYYRGWVEIVVYPAAFRVSRQQLDEIGVMSQEDQILSGESWARGPLILSWQDIQQDMRHAGSGRNVIVHEFAHKLDALNGVTNGMPPLHSDMPVSHWSQAFSKAYASLKKEVLHHHTHINPYAVTSPAEFFAVVSEYFFSAPHVLWHQFPAVYEQLSLFYRQNPLQRLPGSEPQRH